MTRAEKLTVVFMAATLAMTAYYQERNFRLSKANTELAQASHKLNREHADRAEADRKYVNGGFGRAVRSEEPDLDTIP